MTEPVSLDNLRKAARRAWDALEALEEAQELSDVGEGLPYPDWVKVRRFAQHLDGALARAEAKAASQWESRVKK